MPVRISIATVPGYDRRISDPTEVRGAVHVQNGVRVSLDVNIYT